MVLEKAIIKDKQIWKFCFYGFFKNLKFFEPYLYIYLLEMGYTLLDIGILFAIREAITTLFEVPSGIIADHYGKKKELLMCFAFYIVSFILFFAGQNMSILIIGMIFYGLGEAFRSGTHKAMILTYLEHQGWFDFKGFVYGRTRSYSLLGSAVSAFLSIIFILNLPSMKWIFLLSIVPYVIDFVLIATYPDYLDERTPTSLSIAGFYKASISHLRSILKQKTLRKLMVSAAVYDGTFKTVKDYIQPIMNTLLASAGLGLILSFTPDQTLKIILGVIYGIFYICSSWVSKNVHRVTRRFKAQRVYDAMFSVMGGLFILLGLAIYMGWIVLAIVIYFVLYLMMDARRPVFVDVTSDHMDKKERVTVLSIESQLRALLMVILAPVFGYVADQFGMSLLFTLMGAGLMVLNFYLSLPPVDCGLKRDPE